MGKLEKKNLKVICFYHSQDSDGFLSSSIVKYRIDQIDENADFKFVGCNYYDKDLTTKVKRNVTSDSLVFITDFSFSKELMEYIDNKSKKMVWIDHHKTAIEDLPTEYYGKRSVDFSATELTWQHLFPNTDIPKIVDLVGKYDVFNQDDIDLWNDEILPVQYITRALNLNPAYGDNYYFWKKLIRDDVDGQLDGVYELIEKGNTIKLYVDGQAAMMKNRAFERTIKGKKAICMNTNIRSSLSFQFIDDIEQYDLMCAYIFNGKNYMVTLFGIGDTDVSKIGKGHKGAAGLQIKDINDLFD